MTTETLLSSPPASQPVAIVERSLTYTPRSNATAQLRHSSTAWRLVQIFLFNFLAGLLVGCGHHDAPTTSTSQATNATATLDTRTANFSIEPKGTLIAASETPRFNTERQIDNSILIGLDADMSSGSAASGEAIRRGIVLAIDKINAEGGLLGRPLELIVRDHRGNPDRGKNNIHELAEIQDILAVVGGIHTPVAIQELSEIHVHKLIYLCPWAAGTPVVANGYSPNYVFRVSVRDEYAGGFLVSKTLQRGHERIGLLLERTAWGRSNEKAILEALAKAGKTPAAVEWLNWGERNLTAQVNRLHEADVEAVLLVCNCLEGASAVKAIADLPLESRPVVVSHWGISAGSFFDLVSEQLKTVDVSFLQTFSFVASKRPVEARTVFEAYRHRFDDCNTPEDIFSPVGTAHAYEIVLMLATAVRNAGSIETEQVHQALEAISDYEGLIRHYQRPFPPGHHDALTADDFNLAEFDNQGTIRPVQ